MQFSSITITTVVLFFASISATTSNNIFAAATTTSNDELTSLSSSSNFLRSYDSRILDDKQDNITIDDNNEEGDSQEQDVIVGYDDGCDESKCVSCGLASGVFKKESRSGVQVQILLVFRAYVSLLCLKCTRVGNE